MAIVIRLDVVMAQHKMRLSELAEKMDITLTNLSNLKNGKIKAIRLSTLDKLCQHLDCQPSNLLEFQRE